MFGPSRYSEWYVPDPRKAEAAARARALEAARTRDELLRAARAAAEEETGCSTTPEQEVLLRDFARLASESPTVDVRWLSVRRLWRAAPAVGLNNAMASRYRHAVLIWPITSESRYSTALHEVAHLRGRKAPTNLTEEVRAWRWALEHARCWTPAMTADAGTALATYCESASSGPAGVAFSLADVDVLLEDMTRTSRPIGVAVHADRMAWFRSLYGNKVCQDPYCKNDPQPAGHYDTDRVFRCDRCHETREVDRMLFQLKADRRRRQP